MSGTPSTDNIKIYDSFFENDEGDYIFYYIGKSNILGLQHPDHVFKNRRQKNNLFREQAARGFVYCGAAKNTSRRNGVTGFYSAKAFNARSKFPKSSELKSVSQKTDYSDVSLKTNIKNKKVILNL